MDRVPVAVGHQDAHSATDRVSKGSRRDVVIVDVQRYEAGRLHVYFDVKPDAADRQRGGAGPFFLQLWPFRRSQSPNSTCCCSDCVKTKSPTYIVSYVAPT